MKRMICASLLVAVMSGAAFADTIKLDEVFTQTNKWLSEQKLNITGDGRSRDDLAAFEQQTLLFYGKAVGNPEHTAQGQRGIMAEQAAEVMAKKAVIEYLEGFALVGDITVQDCIAKYSVVRTSVAGFAKNVQVVTSEYNEGKNTAIAIVKLGLHGPKGFASQMYDKLLSDPKLKKEISTEQPAFKAKPIELGESYDGLIIDASEQNFKPALINRIFAEKGDVLYDPAKLEKKMLVEQGCGEYTASIDKAKEALAKRGVKNPLIIAANGSTSGSDLKVSDEDAVKVFSANQNGKFFKVAKVAFVLK